MTTWHRFWVRVYWPIFWLNFAGIPLNLLVGDPGWAMFSGTIALFMLLKGTAKTS